MTTRLAESTDHDDAVAVWRAANVARGRPPEAARVDRVRAKLGEPDAIVIVAVASGRVCGMLLAEPGRDLDGRGARVDGLCHISMVFVHPGRQGQGIGRLLLERLRTHMAALAGTRLQVWTGSGNERARRLYRRAGFAPSGRTALLEPGRTIEQFVLDL
ncbi:GNAT family N-acetyltransferase [Actinoallomurus sp. NBC_01490]|uniref:GNAT family N-acetyltransferase n=1 Tax=Actinoallomurus sp. NBC_01490 TaxID=2903557 RepID=UPI002E3179B5|nr:GNAT family N-acetyltransferase [Actinoallomurus sp. NBC_01490]